MKRDLLLLLVCQETVYAVKVCVKVKSDALGECMELTITEVLHLAYTYERKQRE